MKMNKRDINKVAKLLSEITYKPVKEMYYIAIPIETSKIRDFDGVELTVVNKENGVRKPPEPMLIIHSSDKHPVIFGYGDIDYARKFDIFEYCEMLDIKVTKEFDILENLDILMVHKDNILMSFEL